MARTFAALVSVLLATLAGCYTPPWARPVSPPTPPKGPRLGERIETRWTVPLGTTAVKPGYVIGDSLYIYGLDGLLIRVLRNGDGLLWKSNIIYPLDVRLTSDGKGRLFTLSGGNLLILDEKSGAILARRRVTMGAVGGVYHAGKGIAFAGYDSCVHIISPLTGYDIITPNRIEAAVLSADSTLPSLLHMSLDDGTVAAFFTNTGQQAWRSSVGRKPYAGIGLFGDTVFLGGADFYLHRFNAYTGFLAWRVPIGGVARQRPVLSRGRVFVVTLDDNIMRCLRAKDGKLLWEQDVPNCKRFLTADDKHVFFERPGNRIAVADVKTGKILGVTRPLRYLFLQAHPEQGEVFLLGPASNVECIGWKAPKLSPYAVKNGE